MQPALYRRAAELCGSTPQIIPRSKRPGVFFAMIPPTRFLRVETEYFTAGAVFTKYGFWACTKAAPILHWMVGMTGSQAHLALLKMGARWSWLEKHSSDVLSAENGNQTEASGLLTIRPAVRPTYSLSGFEASRFALDKPSSASCTASLPAPPSHAHLIGQSVAR